MKFLYLAFLTVLTSTLVYSQTDEELINLEKQKKRIELEIQNLTNSIGKIDLKIVELNSKKLIEKIKDSSFTALAIKGEKLKKEANLFSDIIMTFGEDKEVIVLDYKDRYFKVCEGTLCGYIHEVWILKSNFPKKFKNSKENDKNNISSKRENSTSHDSSLNNSTYNTYQSTRTYYRGPRGGCYYINSNGNKTYVSRSLCN